MYTLLTPAEGPGISPAAACLAAGAATPFAVASGDGKLGPRRTHTRAAPVDAEAPATEGPAAVPSSPSPTQKRLNFLLQASVHLSSKSPALSRVLQQQLQEVARKHVLRLHASVKHSSCSSCFSLLRPKTATVRQFFQGSSSGNLTDGGTQAASAELHDERAAKRETPGPPAYSASKDSDVNSSKSHLCSSAVKSGFSSCSVSGSRLDHPCHSNSCCSIQSNARCNGECCSASCKSPCCSCCPQGSEFRRRKRRRLLREMVGGRRQQQPPLMEVRCMVCGFVTRRP